MVFLLLVSIFFRGPLTILILMGSIGGQGGIKMASAISGRIVSSGINDVAFTSVYIEKSCLKKLMMMMIMKIFIKNKLQETTFFFCGYQKLTSAMKLMPEKRW